MASAALALLLRIHGARPTPPDAEGRSTMYERQSEAVSESLAALASYLLGEVSLRGTLQRVIDLARQAIPAADSAGLTLLDGGRPSTAVFTSDEAAAVDQLQYDRGEGPCLQAYRDNQVYRVDSNRREPRWPGFARQAAAAGVLSSLSLPLVAGGSAIGALNLYAHRESAFSDGDE